MRRPLIYLFFCLMTLQLSAQSWLGEKLPGAAFTLRFAGSTGLFSAGYSRTTPHKKLEAGLLYGYVPPGFGKSLHILTLQGIYTPWDRLINDRFSLQPLQLGLFISATWGRDLALQWGPEYPKRYYWWTRNLRLHPFAGSQFSYNPDNKYFEKISFYLEANTNDLYIASWFGNMRSLMPWEVLFLGVGLRAYLQ